MLNAINAGLKTTRCAKTMVVTRLFVTMIVKVVGRCLWVCQSGARLARADAQKIGPM